VEEAGERVGRAGADGHSDESRGNGIYERELAVRADVITGTGASPVGFSFRATPQITPTTTVDDAVPEPDQGDAIIGTANYDVGQYSAPAAGHAFLGSVLRCDGESAGVNGLRLPVGDAFDVDFVRP